MQNSLIFKCLAISTAVLSLNSLSGCSLSPEEVAQINSVTTALPNEVTQCRFLGDVNVTAFNMQSARNSLKIQTAELGGNHLVETNVNVVNTPAISYGFRGEPYFAGVDTTFYVSGRAYFCPQGTGVNRGQVPLGAGQSVSPVNQIVPQQPYQVDTPAVNKDQPASQTASQTSTQVAPQPTTQPATQPSTQTSIQPTTQSTTQSDTQPATQTSI